MKIKICGLTRECDVAYANEAQPDYVGFVFAKSRRQVTEDWARCLKRKLSQNIVAVGVFVDEETDWINRLLDEKIVDMAQLHGNETDEAIRRINGPTIKALRLGENPHRPSDFLLFDSPRGGSGLSFDWSKLPAVDKPFFLAGGISLENVQQAVALQPYAIDCSSGVETEGLKDRNKIIQLIRSVRNE